MKEQKILAMILSCLIASVTVGSVAYACAPSTQFNQNFTLTATGQAYDPSSGYVAIQLSLSGTAKGHLDKIVELHVQGGTLSIEGYGTFTISKGEGIVIQRHRYIHLVFKVTPPYGGRCAQWITFGATGDLNGNTLPIPMLYSRGTLVPTTEHPRLYSMVLSGAITGLS